MNADDSVMTCNMEIPYVAHTLKKIPLSSTTFNEFTPKFYDDKNEGLGFLFRWYTKNSINNIDH